MNTMESVDESNVTQGNFKFTCPHCGQHLEAEPDWAGMECECPECGKTLTVPEPPTVATLHTVSVDQIASASPQPEIQTCSTGEREALPPPPIITIMKKGEGVSARKRTWLIPTAIGTVVLLVVGLLVARSKSKEVDIQKPISGPPSSYSPKTLTPRERKAIGKIIYTLANVEANKEKFTRELNVTAGSDASEILMSVAGRVMADYIEKEEGWADCPRDFQLAIKQAYVAVGKSAISAIVEKYGKPTVMNTLKQYKVHANYTKYFIEVMDDNAASIAKEMRDAQAQMRVCLAKYGIDGNDIASMAIGEFAEQRMSASGYCKELMQGKDYFKLVDDHTAMWDPGGEDPPMVCIVSFDDNGTASLMQDNTFFARENPRIPMEALARKLESAFTQANQYDYKALREVRNVTARVQNGHLFFGGEITVEPGKVEEKVNLLFHSLNKTRIYVRVY